MTRSMQTRIERLEEHRDTPASRWAEQQEQGRKVLQCLRAKIARRERMHAQGLTDELAKLEAQEEAEFQRELAEMREPGGPLHRGRKLPPSAL